MAVDTEKLLADELAKFVQKGEAHINSGIASVYSDGVLTFKALAWNARDTIIAALRRGSVPVAGDKVERVLRALPFLSRYEAKFAVEAIAEPVGEDQLPPCPFCGGEARHAHPSQAPAVYCSNCRSSSPDVRIWRGEMQDIAASERALAEDDRVARLRAAVSIAEIVFDEYARLHRQKDTAEGDAKAKRNEEFSAKMSAEDTRDGRL